MLSRTAAWRRSAGPPRSTLRRLGDLKKRAKLVVHSSRISKCCRNIGLKHGNVCPFADQAARILAADGLRVVEAIFWPQIVGVEKGFTLHAVSFSGAVARRALMIRTVAPRSVWATTSNRPQAE
jgi:hypothetical protein